MRLVRFGEPGRERPGLVDAQGTLRDLSGHLEDIDSKSIRAGELAQVHSLDATSLSAVQGQPRLGCPVGHIGKIVCIGLNYTDHAAEVGAALPTEPIVFMKSTTSICGPDDDVLLPPGSEQSDWEVELGVVIGRRMRFVAEADALKHVAGYCIVNDVSERFDQIKRGSQWTLGKSHDTFCPVGPWLVTADEVSDPQQLAMWCEVDDHRMQESHTSRMIFGVAHCLAHLSCFMTLEPGDLVATGTPAGVGLGKKPPRFLRDGETMRLGIAGLGVQTQAVKRASRPA